MKAWNALRQVLPLFAQSKISEPFFKAPACQLRRSGGAVNEIAPPAVLTWRRSVAKIAVQVTPEIAAFHDDLAGGTAIGLAFAHVQGELVTITTP